MLDTILNALEGANIEDAVGAIVIFSIPFWLPSALAILASF